MEGAAAAGAARPDWVMSLAEVEVGRVVGGGALGEVRLGAYRGLQLALKELYLLRTDAASLARMGGIALSAAERRSLTETFLRECELLRSAVHPNVVPFIGVVVDREPRYLATLYMRDGNLQELIHAERYADMRPEQGGTLALETQLVAAIDVFSALAYLATLPLIHRDIKPANILIVVSADRKLTKVLLADFGEAKQLSQTVTMHTVAGTPAYMAPEMREDEVGTGPPADTFSFGIALAEMSSGKQPSPGPEMRREGGRRVGVPEEERRAADIAAVRHVEVRVVVQRCVVDDPQARATAAEMLEHCRSQLAVVREPPRITVRLPLSLSF